MRAIFRSHMCIMLNEFMLFTKCIFAAAHSHECNEPSSRKISSKFLFLHVSFFKMSSLGVMLASLAANHLHIIYIMAGILFIIVIFIKYLWYKLQHACLNLSEVDFASFLILKRIIVLHIVYDQKCTYFACQFHWCKNNSIDETPLPLKYT